MTGKILGGKTKQKEICLHKLYLGGVLIRYETKTKRRSGDLIIKIEEEEKDDKKEETKENNKSIDQFVQEN